MNILLILSLLLSGALANELIRIQDIQCFEEEKNAQKVLEIFRNNHEVRKKAVKHIKRPIPAFDISLVKDTSDKFGRRNCLISPSRSFSGHELKLIASFQVEEDQMKKKKEVRSIKDPWGGEVINLDGSPRILRACRIVENKKEDDLHCEDLIITALLGQEDVIEYRFWLGARSGKGMAVYKSTRNSLELAKVIAELKKDKENFNYTFSPKDKSSFLQNPIIGGQ